MCSVILPFYHRGLFFFFKQKTAYERRISDWSSDVCSSDLLDTGVEDRRGCGLRLGHEEELHQVAELGPARQLVALPLAQGRGQVARELAGVDRSEDRRGGQEGVSTWRSRWSPHP